MALASHTALQLSVAFAPLRAMDRVAHHRTDVVIAEPVESAIDEAFLDAMTNVFGDHRPVHLPGRLDVGGRNSLD